MNRGFFVVFLGIILGAMALIFLNQTSNPVDGMVAQGGEPVVVASNDRPSPQPGTPEPPASEQGRPAPAKPEVSRPEVSRPEPPKPAVPAPEAPTPEPARSVAPATPASPASPASMTPPPEMPKPQGAPPAPVKPETVKPETPKPETPAPEPAKTEPEASAMTPVTSTPETLVKPGAQTRKALTLVNIGLHFKGNGMALRIEADAPFSYKTFALDGPARYVVDLVGTWNKMRAPTVPSNNMIKGARSGPQPGGPRLVLDMQRAPKKHSITWISPTVLEVVIE